jgi:uncharacterized protein YndB with AHSA1/START domain
MSDQNTAAGKTEVRAGNDREIISERVFDAPREKVFAAMIDPELIPQWWGRRGSETVVDKMDVREGGDWRFLTGDCDSPEPEHAFRGTYREIAAPERLVQTFEWEGMPGHVVVETVTLEDLGDGRTKFTNVSLFNTTEERDGMLASGMEVGQNESHERLQELLSQ